MLIYQSWDFHDPFDIAIATDGNVDSDSFAWSHLWTYPAGVRTRLHIGGADPLLPPIEACSRPNSMSGCAEVERRDESGYVG